MIHTPVLATHSLTEARTYLSFRSCVDPAYLPHCGHDTYQNKYVPGLAKQRIKTRLVRFFIDTWVLFCLWNTLLTAE